MCFRRRSSRMCFCVVSIILNKFVTFFVLSRVRTIRELYVKYFYGMCIQSELAKIFNYLSETYAFRAWTMFFFEMSNVRFMDNTNISLPFSQWTSIVYLFYCLYDALRDFGRFMCVDIIQRRFSVFLFFCVVFVETLNERERKNVNLTMRSTWPKVKN